MDLSTWHVNKYGFKSQVDTYIFKSFTSIANNFLGTRLYWIFNMYNINKTCNADAWRKDYFGALFPLNPSSIIPKGENISKIVNQ